MEDKNIITENKGTEEVLVTIREKQPAPADMPEELKAGQKEPADVPQSSAAGKTSAEVPVKSRSGRSAGRHSASGNQAKRSASKQGGSSVGQELLHLLIKIAVIALAVFLVGRFVLGVHLNHGNHMYPFVMDGDLVITYRLEPCRVGDIVLYQDPISGKNRISRIVAKGGSTVVITQEGQLVVDNYIPNETVFYLTQPAEDSSVEYPYVVGEGGLFLLDDFRTNGSDSRIFGEISTDDVKGKAVYIIRRRGL
jgi:signal peptidase I